ncbi:MAG: SIMPL domain-containing protein, partial [Patescibacteria group bacterium]
TVSAAQQENTRVMNDIIGRMKAAGVDKKDIQTTNYSVYPAYDYMDGKQRLRGYVVSQNVRVKVRNLDKVSDILGVAGRLGANQIGGVNFTIDDPEALRQQARVLALENAKDKAEALAAVVGAKIRRVVSFQENVGGVPQPIYYGKAMGMGMAAEAAPAPTVEAGSSEIVVTADVTYEIE